MTSFPDSIFPAADSAIPGQALSPTRHRTWLKIVKGSARAFGKSGYAGTTVDDILLEAGVSRRTLYQFYSQKEDLLLALYERSTTHLLEQTKAAVAKPGSAGQRLLRGQQVYLSFSRHTGRIVQVLAEEALRPGGPLADQRLWLHEQIELLYQQVLHDDGRTPPHSIAIRALILQAEALVLHVLCQHDGNEQVMQEAKQLMDSQLDRLVKASTREARPSA